MYTGLLGAFGLTVAAGSNPASTTDTPIPVATTLEAVTGTATPRASAASSPAELRAAQVENAVSTLEAFVARRSSDDALGTAMRAYYNYVAAHPEKVKNPYLYFVDYGLDNRTPRGYVFDMEQLTLVEGPFIVAHGRGSSAAKNAVPTRFTNREGSATTSLGLYVTQESYGFSGHTSGKLYRSVGLRLEGVSGRFNNAARERRVVVHGAPYVNATGAGRSEGCPAMEQSRAQRLIPMIANGGLVFLYSPNEADWAATDPWATAEY
ncbi:MAG: murein L,D-transpeptidase catalytic domain-containing protein [Longimicrobiales bacterium]